LQSYIFRRIEFFQEKSSQFDKHHTKEERQRRPVYNSERFSIIYHTHKVAMLDSKNLSKLAATGTTQDLELAHERGEIVFTSLTRGGLVKGDLLFTSGFNSRLRNNVKEHSN